MRPNCFFKVNHRRFFASLTILCVTFTQVLPAWAASGLDRSRETLRPAGLEGKSKSDLEVALGGGITPTQEDLISPKPTIHAGLECRVCAMRGNVIKGILGDREAAQPGMLQLMLTGGYDGSGIAIKLHLKDSYRIIDFKDKGHLYAMLPKALDSLDKDLRKAVAEAYETSPEEVEYTGHGLLDDDSFVVDPDFGTSVLKLKVKGQEIRVPMEGIGHTRWRTQGAATQVNSHPFVLEVPIVLPNGRKLIVALAHNGNFNVSSQFAPHVVAMGVPRAGETDSEVLAGIFALMHRGEGATVVTAHLALERAQRFIKYVEDWLFLINFLRDRSTEARKHQDQALEFLKRELQVWGVTLPQRIGEADLLKLAEDTAVGEGDSIVRQGLARPWLFDDPGDATRQDIALRLSEILLPASEIKLTEEDTKKGVTAEKKAKDQQKDLRKKFFDPHYSDIAVVGMNNAEGGFVVSRGRTGGSLEVYVPPLQALAERMSAVHAAKEREEPPTTVRAAKKSWGSTALDVSRQLRSVELLVRDDQLWLEQKERGILSQLLARANSLRATYAGDDWELSGDLSVQLQQEREKLLGLLKEIQEFATRNVRDRKDRGERLVASERRAFPAVPGTSREHPEKHFAEIGRGEVDTYTVEAGHVVTVSRQIHRTSLWGEELDKPVSKSIAKTQMVDRANLTLGSAKSRLEREIANQAFGWKATADQFQKPAEADGDAQQKTPFPHLTYSDQELASVEEWYFVGEGTSGNLAKAAQVIGESVPGNKMNFQYKTGEQFYDLVASGNIKLRAQELARRGKRLMVTFITNTGETETVKQAAEKINELNQQLDSEQRVLPSVVTNVVGSAIDTVVSQNDGDPHAIYTLVGYEMSVPATGSFLVGVMSMVLLVKYVQAVQGALPRGKTDFYHQLEKVNQAIEKIGKVIEREPDGALRVTPE